MRLFELGVVRDLELYRFDPGFLLEALGAFIGRFVEGFVELAAIIIDQRGLGFGRPGRPRRAMVCSACSRWLSLEISKSR